MTLATTMHKIETKNTNFLSMVANINQRKYRKRVIGREKERMAGTRAGVNGSNPSSVHIQKPNVSLKPVGSD